VSGAASHATAQYKAEFKNSLVVGPTGPWGEAAVKFADLLKERTQGRINVVNYFDGRLFAGKQTTEFKLLDQGVADFAMGSTINWSPQVKELNLFSLPFLFPSYKALDAVEDGEPGQRLWKLIEAKGVIPLAWGENGFRDLTNSKRAVRTPQDLDRLKVRVVGSPIFMETFRALGASPVNMNWSKAQSALNRAPSTGRRTRWSPSSCRTSSGPCRSTSPSGGTRSTRSSSRLEDHLGRPHARRPRDREEDSRRGHGRAEAGRARRPRRLHRGRRHAEEERHAGGDALQGRGRRLPGEDEARLRQVGGHGRRRPREVRGEHRRGTK
jgi:hypothetical protein